MNSDFKFFTLFKPAIHRKYPNMKPYYTFLENGLKITDIKKIESRRKSYVYNLEIEGNNNYFANNLLVHNCCRYFKDNILIIVSTDSDYEQLAEYKNVKLFSPKSKNYKIVKNPTAILAKKIQKETADNLITKIVTEEDYKKREMIVNLLRLPEEIENKVIQELSNIKVNDNFDPTKIPFGEMRRRYMSIYSTTNINVEEVDNKNIIKPKIRFKKPLIQKLLTL